MRVVGGDGPALVAETKVTAGGVVSLNINVDKVQAVLLADGWHEVVGKSFDLDAYEFHDNDVVVHGGGQSGVCATGFRFKTKDGVLTGPLTAVLAVRS